MTDTVTDTFESVGEGTEKAFDATVDFAGDAFDSTKDASDKVFKSIGNFFGGGDGNDDSKDE